MLLQRGRKLNNSKKMRMCASVNIELPGLRMVEPTERDGYMIVARDLLQGVEALSTLPNVPSRAAVFIAAHALECALHAFLWHKGVDAGRKPKVWHDLLALWGMACKEGLNIPQASPDWVTILSSGHGRPFYFRYQKGKQGTVVHGGQTPALIPMAVELKKFIEIVELAVKG